MSSRDILPLIPNLSMMKELSSSQVLLGHREGEAVTYLTETFCFAERDQALVFTLQYDPDGAIYFTKESGLSLAEGELGLTWGDDPLLFNLTFDGREENPVKCWNGDKQLGWIDGRLGWSSSGLFLETVPLVAPEPARSTPLDQVRLFINSNRHGVVLLVLLFMLFLSFLLQRH